MGSFGLTDVSVGYGGVDVVRHASIEIEAGTCVALLGPNGAGKSTLLRALTGQLRLRAGTRWIDDANVSKWTAHRLARAGLRWVGDPRPLYPDLTVDQNLTVGGMTNRHRLAINRERVYGLLPELKPRGNEKAGRLSGGQQQMVAFGQALMGEPRYLCIDEPSMGLAPPVVTRMADIIRALADDGVGVLWAEQFPKVVLARCERVVILSGGVIVRDCAREAISDSSLEAAYLGTDNYAVSMTDVHNPGE